VDRWVIAERLSAQRPQGRGPLQVCLQVNVDEEESKHGLAPGDVQALVELARKIHPLPGLCLRGLMAIPAPSQDIAQQRQAFAAVRTLFDKVKAALPDTSRFDTLSMGMSHDLEAAIAEGASWVRVGTAIFGERA
jgi:pyridoxal phosphate enzyme (YggS family)